MLDNSIKARIEELFIACPDQWSFEDSFRAICKDIFAENKEFFLDTPQNRSAIYSHMDEIYEYV